MVRYQKSKGAYIPKEWIIMSPGEKVEVISPTTASNINELYGMRGPKSGLSKLKKGQVGTVMGMTSPTSLSSTHVVKFGKRYVYIHDYDIKKGRVKVLRV